MSWNIFNLFSHPSSQPKTNIEEAIELIENVKRKGESRLCEKICFVFALGSMTTPNVLLGIAWGNNFLQNPILKNNYESDCGPLTSNSCEDRNQNTTDTNNYCKGYSCATEQQFNGNDCQSQLKNFCNNQNAMWTLGGATIVLTLLNLVCNAIYLKHILQKVDLQSKKIADYLSPEQLDMVRKTCDVSMVTYHDNITFSDLLTILKEINSKSDAHAAIDIPQNHGELERVIKYS